MNKLNGHRNGYTLTELIVSMCISACLLAAVFSLILVSLKIAGSMRIYHDRELCIRAVIEPIGTTMESASEVVLTDDDEDGTASAVLLSVNGRKTLVTASDISFIHEGTEYNAVCGENEVCLQSFSDEGKAEERIVLKNPSESVLIEGLEFLCTDEERGVFMIRLLMNTTDGKTSEYKKYVCVFAA